jgi:hypothetical protein
MLALSPCLPSMEHPRTAALAHGAPLNNCGTYARPGACGLVLSTTRATRTSWAAWPPGYATWGTGTAL